MGIVTADDMVCPPCALRLCDKCRGRCLCAHEDITVMAAQALALAMAHFRHMLNDAGYAAVLGHFEGLAAALPVPVEVPSARDGEQEASKEKA